MSDAEDASQAGTGGPGRESRALVARGRQLRTGISAALTAPDARRASARRAFEAVRQDVVRRELAKMPLSRIRDVTEGRLRLGPIEAAGYRTVGQAAAAGRQRLEAIQGVGPLTASQVIGAAHQLELAMLSEVRIRFDPDARPRLEADLLAELHQYDVAKRAVAPQAASLNDLMADLDLVLSQAAKGASRMRMFFSGRDRKQTAHDALGRLTELMSSPETEARQARLDTALASLNQPKAGADFLWDDYQTRAVDYNGLLIEVGELATDVDAGHGFIPSDLAQRIHAHPLDLTLMRASLRGYQAFGAKFALAQRRAILGDEMGLGKTIEALATMCHLHTEGKKHFLVVCPASVIVNWVREIEHHSELRGYRIHGADRERNLRAWTLRGGVGVTTFDALKSMPVPQGVDIGLLVVDEAHYVKNPAAARTKAVRQWVARAGGALFLTGTPMENRVEEFQTLVGHLNPRLAAGLPTGNGALGATGFRKAVAPVYLRRDQADVLSELPDRLETQEWVELEGKALVAYRDAVASGNFMSMRRAAYAPGTPDGSAKLRRLVELVEEAAANNRRTVVFSFFRDVLGAVASVLKYEAPGVEVFGPLTGSDAPPARQRIVDDFSASKGPAVLVSQIEAGGVGLNIQSASVVILTEPQWKPTTEEQAIARCHRLGQVRQVDVYRLLAEDSVDQRMLDVLKSKAILFDEYARRSDLKDSSPDAVDVSDLKAARDTSSRAEVERRIVELERKRLRLQDDVPIPRHAPDSDLNQAAAPHGGRDERPPGRRHLRRRSRGWLAGPQPGEDPGGGRHPAGSRPGDGQDRALSPKWRRSS